MSGSGSTVAVELSAEEYERLMESASSAGLSEEALLAELVDRHLGLTESIQTYTECGKGSGNGREADRLLDVPPPIARLVGFRLVEIGEGRAKIAFTAGPEHANPMGTLHGGVYGDVGDAAMGIAFSSTLEEDESFTTLQLDVSFHKPIWDAELEAVGTVVKRGRRTGLVECTVTDDTGSLVAKLSSTCLILRGAAARGR